MNDKGFHVDGMPVDNATKERLSNAFSQALQEQSDSRRSDLETAQDNIRQSPLYCAYTLIAMMAVPPVAGYVAIVGLFFICSQALGVFEKYRSRVLTRLRADELRKMQMDITGMQMAQFKGCVRDIPVRDVGLFEVVWSKRSIAFVYMGLMVCIVVAWLMDIPTRYGLKFISAVLG